MFYESPILHTAPLLQLAERGRAHRPRQPGLIGPNAVLKLAEVMHERLDAETCARIFRDARVDRLPSGEHMIPELHAMRLHRWLALHEPAACDPIAWEAGLRTADYIIAHRIPAPARALLRWLPSALAAPLLMKAIRAHAWTFVGSGEFTPQSAWRFTIARQRADDTVKPGDTVFHWYAAVFERLYQRLVNPAARCFDRGPDGSHPLNHLYAIECRRQG